MRRMVLTISLSLFIIFSSLQAQEKKWTLEDCINYAVSNNINLQRQKLQTQVSQVNYLKSEMDLLPSLNLSANGRVGFGRSVDPVTNLITFKQNLSNSYSLSTGIQLFSGFTALNTISANKFLLKAGLESEKVTRNTLIVNIMGQFYQVLYTKGIEDAAKMQLNLSEKQLFRIQKMVETGREALSKQYEIESQVSADRLAYTIARNSASQTLTTLKQLLQISHNTSFEVLLPDLNNILTIDKSYSTDSIYNLATQNLPRLKQIEYELLASKKQVAAAWGAVAPNLTAGGSIYTGYYKVLNETGQPAYNTQIKNNNSQSIFLTLSIPLFNNFATARNIKIARIRRNDADLRLQLEKNSLYTDIENACLDFNRGKDEFAAAVANFDFNKKSFDAVEKKFESGIVDVTDYSASKTKLFRAETEALRTKLQMIIRKLTIQFYSTGEYEKIIIN